MISALAAAAMPANLWLGVERVVIRCTTPVDAGAFLNRNFCTAVAAEAASGARIQVTTSFDDPFDTAIDTMLLDVAVRGAGADVIVKMDAHRAVETGENDRASLTRTFAHGGLTDVTPVAAMLDQILPWRARPTGQRLRRMKQR